MSKWVSASDLELLPPLPGVRELARYPPGFQVPNVTAKARKRSWCVGCSRAFDAGDEYWYFPLRGRSARERYCSGCRAVLIAKMAQYEKVYGEPFPAATARQLTAGREKSK